MYARNISNHNAPMRILFRVLRGPLTGGHGTRFQRQSRRLSQSSQAEPCPDISTRSLISQQSSKKSSAASHNPPTPSAFEDTQEEQPDIKFSLKAIRHVQRIANLSRQLSVLGRRFQFAEKKTLHYEYRVEEFHRLLRDIDWQLEEGDEQDLILKQLEAAYIHADEVKQQLASDITCEESNLKFSLDDLVDELKGLLLPAGLPMLPDDASRDSEHDFPPEETDSNAAEHENAEVEVQQDPEKEANRAALRRLRRAKDKLHGVQIRFDNRQKFEDEDLRAYLEGVDTGQCDVSRTDFDLNQVIEHRELTQQLAAAEHEHTTAAYEAMMLSVIELEELQTSWFAEQDEDHEGAEEEVQLSIARTNLPFTEKWAEGVVSDVDSLSPPAVSDERDIRSLQFGEACSAIAHNRERTKIDRWELLRREDWDLMQDQADVPKPQLPASPNLGLWSYPLPLAVSGRGRARSCSW